MKVYKNKINVIFLDLFGVLIGSDNSEIINYTMADTHLSINEVKSLLFGEECMKLARNEISFDMFYLLKSTLTSLLISYPVFYIFNKIDRFG